MKAVSCGCDHGCDGDAIYADCLGVGWYIEVGDDDLDRLAAETN